MTPTERTVAFGCQEDHLLGVLTACPGSATVGVVIVVGGPQYRAGAHRQFVLMARALAAAGFPVLRFDQRGMGDSTGAQRRFEDVAEDIGAAVDALQAAVPGVRRVVLWGLCDGASAALLYLQRPDPRVAGLALINPWVRSAASLAKTHVKHYYLERLKQRSFWIKLLSGKIAVAALAGLLANVRSARAAAGPSAGTSGPFQDRMASAWLGFTGSILLLLSENDYTAREFEDYTAESPAWQRAFERCAPTRISLAGADHTCASPAAQRAAESATVQWLRTVVAGNGIDGDGRGGARPSGATGAPGRVLAQERA